MPQLGLQGPMRELSPALRFCLLHQLLVIRSPDGAPPTTVCNLPGSLLPTGCRGSAPHGNPKYSAAPPSGVPLPNRFASKTFVPTFHALMLTEYSTLCIGENCQQTGLRRLYWPSEGPHVGAIEQTPCRILSITAILEVPTHRRPLPH